MLAGNTWTAAALVATRIAGQGRANPSRAGVQVLTGHVLRLAAAEHTPIQASGGLVRIWSLDGTLPDGITLACATCRNRFRTDGAGLAWLASHHYGIPRQCPTCRPSNSDQHAAEVVRMMAAEREREDRERRSRQRKHGSPVDMTPAYTYEPGEGPGTPGGCIHGLPRNICRTCSRRASRS